MSFFYYFCIFLFHGPIIHVEHIVSNHLLSFHMYYSLKFPFVWTYVLIHLLSLHMYYLLKFSYCYMKLDPMDNEASSAKTGAGQCQWTPTQSSFMLTFLANIIADGTKTSTGFKKVHLNACAKAVNDYCKVNRTGDQISNHLKTWKKKFNRINYLRKLSAALWDEDNFIISLDHEHYTSYIQVKIHKLFFLFWWVGRLLCH